MNWYIDLPLWFLRWLAKVATWIKAWITAKRRRRRLPPSPKKKPHHVRKKTLILDLDETLIHSTTWPVVPSDFVVNVCIQYVPYQYYVYKRPHVDFFLHKVAQWYKLVVFTASVQDYADPVIDYLDAHNKLFHARFFRHNCIQVGSSYLKDLTVVEKDLSQVCLLDNSPASYSIHQANGIPIEGWLAGPHDQALLDLLPFLDALRFTEDVRSVLGLRLYTPNIT